MKKACCGFGHRNVFENIEDKLYTSVMSAAERGCEIFYTGAMGEFDSLFSSAVRLALRNLSLISVLIFLSRISISTSKKTSETARA